MTAAAPWLSGPAGAVRVNAAHTEQVIDLPTGAVVLCSNDDCPVGAFRIGTQVFATQYHPEMTDAFIAAVVDTFAPKLGKTEHDDALASLTPPADTDRFIGWIVGFFEQPVQPVRTAPPADPSL